MEQNKMNKSEAKWKEVMIGGVSGIALGTAGTLLASSIPIDAAAENSDSQDTPNTENEATNTTAQMATCVNDSMSFLTHLMLHVKKSVLEVFLNGMVIYIVHILLQSGIIWMQLQEMSLRTQFIGMVLHMNMCHQITANPHIQPIPLIQKK